MPDVRKTDTVETQSNSVSDTVTASNDSTLLEILQSALLPPEGTWCFETAW